MDRKKLISQLRCDFVNEEVSTKEFAETLRPVILSAIFRSSESFALFSSIDEKQLKAMSSAEIKALATAAKAHCENARQGFKLLEDLDKMKPAQRAKISNKPPIKLVK